MLAYNIWQDKHYDNIYSLLDKLQSLNINTVFIVNGINLQYPDSLADFEYRIEPSELLDVINICAEKGFRVWLKPHVHSLHAYGNRPNWWQGFVGLEFSEEEYDRFFSFIYPQMCLLPLFHYSTCNKIDGLVLGTELASLVNAPEWSIYNNVLKQVVPGQYQPEHFKITYAHNSWQPILVMQYSLIRTMKFWLGTESIIDKVLNEQPRWNIIDSYKKPLGEAIYQGKGRISCFDELDYIGLDCYPYWTYDTSYNSQKIKRLLSEYEYSTKLWFWTLRYNIDYLSSIDNWLNTKDMIITECSTMGNRAVRYDLDFQVRWWSIILKLFNHVKLIGIWDDGIVLDAIEELGTEHLV